jgi:hypothetical protein
MKWGFCLPRLFLSAALAASHAQADPANTSLPVNSNPLSPSSSPSHSDTEAPTLPRCSEISALGPEFNLLAGACEYALSQRTLPNFICQETEQRSAGGQPLDVLTVEAAFAHGLDRYSNWAINGHPVESPYDSSGWVSDAMFGHQLTAIFRPESKTSFRFDRQSSAGDASASVFSFHFGQKDNTSFNIYRSRPGMSGSIWIDRKSGHLLRVTASASEINRKYPLASYSSEMNYREVPIPDLGDLLLPVDGQVQICFQQGSCFKNLLSFHDCRKFGSEARIVPNN